MKQKNQFERFLYSRWLRTALPVLSFALIILLGLSVTIASMYSSTDGTDIAAVAVFAVDAENTTTGNLTINCNTGAVTADYDFWVANMNSNYISDVSIVYTIQVTLPSALPTGLTMEIDGIAGTASADGLTYTFENDSVWSFNNGVGEAQDHTLTFTADPDTANRNINLAGISVRVVAEQTD